MDFSDAMKIVSEHPGDILQAMTIDSGASGQSPEDFMKLAVCIAAKSTQEKPVKIFGKIIPQPKIGAVLTIGDKAYCSARSGFKVGDHAEFTVINSMAKKDFPDLSDATLYTTLEPCTPQARSLTSESCSKLIINNRIKKVFVGSVDANPLVTGLGIKDMSDNGVDVQLFSKEQADSASLLNKDFFDFFSDVMDPKAIKSVDAAIWGDIDPEAVAFYCQKNGLAYENDEASGVASAVFIQDMIKRGAIKEGNGLAKIAVSESFAIAFFKDPSIKVHDFGIDFYEERSETDRKGRTGVEKARNTIKASALVACRDYLPKSQGGENNNVFSRILREYGVLGHLGEDRFPLDRIFVSGTAARELIENAVLHNDYSLNPRISIHFYRDHIEIYNAVNILKKDLDRLNKGSMPSIPQNPELMQYFESCGLAEHHHFGMNEVKNGSLPLYKDKDKKAAFVFDKDTIKGKTFLITRLSVR